MIGVLELLGLPDDPVELHGLQVEKEIDESNYGKVIRYLQRLNPFQGIFKGVGK